MRRVLIVLILGVVGGCVASTQQIIVAAAADLNYALTEHAHQFERSTGHKVTLSFGASGNLFSQILNGAPVDLYFSADEEYPKNLVVAGIADGFSLKTYAIGHLVLWVPNGSLDPNKLQMDLLTQPNAQAGLIALSIAMSPAMQSAGKYWELPTDAYAEFRQTAVIISSTKQKNVATEFLDFALSAGGAAVFKQFGLTTAAHP